MKNLSKILIYSALVLTASASAKVITVNTTNNVSTGAGETNLVQAIDLLEDGDTIRFNIPGAGPHYLVTPPGVMGDGGGYPEITKNNVTIDGYSQPGASPNTNTILAANSAQIKIVLDSRGGGRHIWNIDGYGDSESGILVVSGYNFHIQGVSLLSVPGMDTAEDPKVYGIALGKGADNAHISGCWFGVDPDGRTVAGFNDGITGFRFDGTDMNTNVVVGVKPGSVSPRSEFNVFVGLEIPIIIEGNTIRVSGNFIGVLPDGVTRVPNPKYVDGWEGHIEIGREGWDSVIGTDGDGVNDAEERNVLSGGYDDRLSALTTESTYDTVIEFYSNNNRTNIVIAGNYVGLGVDGRFFPHSTRLLNGLNNQGTVRVGSDFDGVSDAIEGNVIAANHPFSELWPTPVGSNPAEFMGVDMSTDGSSAERISLRGNTLINNNIAPLSYANGLSGIVEKLTNYYAVFTATNLVVPQLSTNSSQARIQGACDLGLDPYTNIIIDLYVADPEGWTNGQKFEFFELSYMDTNGLTFYNGFPQGRTYLGSFVDNGTQDSNPVAGAFDFDVSALHITAGTLVTITANYSADPPGTHNGRTQTSVFSNPVAIKASATPAGPRVSITRGGNNTIILSWPFSAGSFSIQSTPLLNPTTWSTLTPQPTITQVGDNYQATLPLAATGSMYLRLSK